MTIRIAAVVGARPRPGNRTVAGQTGWLARVFLCAGLVLWAAAPPVAAAEQQQRATPPLETDHWAYAALDRLGAARLLAAPYVGQRPLSEGAVAAALNAAARLAEEENSPLAEFAREAGQRFQEETGVSLPPGAIPVWGRVDAGYRDAAGRPAEGRSAVVGLRVRLAPAGSLLALYEPEFHQVTGAGSQVEGEVETGLELRHRRLAAGARVGPAWIFAGRERIRYGPAAGGAVVVGDLPSHDALVFGLEEPVTLPGWGRYLGPFTATMMVRRMPDDSLMRRGAGYFYTQRISFSPHRRFQVGLNRKTLLVPERFGEPLEFTRLLYSTFGGHTDYEDQKASVDMRFQAAVRGVPLAAYFEIGAEDTGGAFYRDPGLTAGVHLPVVPGLPAASFRYEYTAFGRDGLFCFFCRYDARRWYHHRIRTRYMTEEGESFGHPLGGYGHEHRLEGRAWLLESRLRAGVVLLQRNRTAEERGTTNMLYPTRPGRSRGVHLDAAWRATERVEAVGRVQVERGREGWGERYVWLGVSRFF